MTSFVRPACLALAFVATALPARAQTWIYEPDTPRARVYEPRSYEPRGYEPVYESRGYEPRAYEPRVYEPRTYEPDTRVVVGRSPLALTPAQRTTIYRTIIPQGRGRGPIVKERIVSESVAPAPWSASAWSRSRRWRITPLARGCGMPMRSRRCRKPSSPRSRMCARTGTW